MIAIVTAHWFSRKVIFFKFLKHERSATIIVYRIPRQRRGYDVWCRKVVDYYATCKPISAHLHLTADQVHFHRTTQVQCPDSLHLQTPGWSMSSRYTLCHHVHLIRMGARWLKEDCNINKFVNVIAIFFQTIFRCAISLFTITTVKKKRICEVFGIFCLALDVKPFRKVYTLYLP